MTKKAWLNIYFACEYSFQPQFGIRKLKNSSPLVIFGTRPDQSLFPAQFSPIKI